MVERSPDGRIGPPVRNDEYRDLIEHVRNAGDLDELLLFPADSYDHADEVRRGLYRSARYYCSCGEPQCTRKHDNKTGCPDGGQRITFRGEVTARTGEDDRKHYYVEFRLHDKREAWRSMIVKYGPDRSAWPYDPRARKLRGKANG